MSTVTFVSLMYGAWRNRLQGPHIVKRDLLAHAAYYASSFCITTVVPALADGWPGAAAFAAPAVAFTLIWIALSVIWLDWVLPAGKPHSPRLAQPFGVSDWTLIGAMAVRLTLALNGRASASCVSGSASVASQPSKGCCWLNC
jgi:hypothetical protein